MIRYALSAAILAVIAMGVLLYAQGQRMDRAATALARAERQVIAVEAQLTQARLAREVEAARAEKAAADAREATAALDEIMATEGDAADAPIDPAIRDALRRLRDRSGTDPDRPGRAPANPQSLSGQ